MSIEDIRRRYQPAASDQSDVIKRLREQVAQQAKDIRELLAALDGAKAKPVINVEYVPTPGAEDAAIDAELESAGLTAGEYVPRGTITPSREAENQAFNAERGAQVAPTFKTASRGIPMEAGFGDFEPK
jgi:hypothetical protein